MSATDSGLLMRTTRRTFATLVAGLLFVTFTPALARAAEKPRAGVWHRPVDGAVVRAFEPPASVYGPGHRGVDFAAAPGTPVRAANDGIVAFAGSVAGSLHVTVDHGGDVRTSYSFLQSIAVHEGQAVARGDVVGTTGGVNDDHDGHVLHFGVRVAGRYVDPMTLFRVDDLTRLVHLVPTDLSAEEPWTAGDERRELAISLHLALPTASGGASSTTPANDTDQVDGGDCGDGIPLVGDVVTAACTVGELIADGAGAAIDAGLRYLDGVTNVASDVLDRLRGPLHATVEMLRTLPATAADAFARTPVGQFALDVVAMGRRFANAVFGNCRDDAPDADGTGGSTHRVMVVAGINSSGLAGDRGATVGLDVAALGYHPDEGEVRYYSYAADGGAYQAADTYGPLRVAAHRLGDQLRAMQREEPGREVDLIAHSQGGIVVDLFLQHEYRADDPTLPPLGTVVTLSSPHEGAPLASAGSQIRSTPFGEEVIDAVTDVVPNVPSGNSPSVREMSEGSAVIAGIQRRGVPEHVDFTSIGATEDVVVPATNISLRGAEEVTVAVNSPSEHSAIVRDPNALRAVRAALEGRAPPCVDLATALRGAVAPVFITRLSHDVGDIASTALRAGATP